MFPACLFIQNATICSFALFMHALTLFQDHKEDSSGKTLNAKVAESGVLGIICQRTRELCGHQL